MHAADKNYRSQFLLDRLGRCLKPFAKHSHKDSRKASRRASVRLKEPGMAVGTAVTVDRQQPIVPATTSAVRTAVAVDRQRPIVTATP